MKRILITGMSGTGKSTISENLKIHGYKSIDLDSYEYSEWVAADPSDTLTPEPGRDWQWQEERVRNLLAVEDADTLILSGCAENMGQFLTQFDYVILLSAEADILIERLAARTTNSFGKQAEQVVQVLELKKTIEPLLRKVANLEIDTGADLKEVVSKILQTIKELNPL